MCVYIANNMQSKYWFGRGFAETAFSLRQTDIAGFYNQVEHDRILLAIQFAIFIFASQCEQGLDTVMQSHVVRLERILRVFQGSWREKTKQYMTITLRDIPSLVQYLLDHSYFTVGSQVFRQRRGASMGSQFAPWYVATDYHFGITLEQTFTIYAKC